MPVLLQWWQSLPRYQNHTDLLRTCWSAILGGTSWLRLPPGESPLCQQQETGLGLKGCGWTTKRCGILGLRRRRIQFMARDRLDCSELLCNKVLLKYKGDRERFWRRHQTGAERIPTWQSLAGCYIITSSLLIKGRKCLKTLRMAPGPSPTRCILI